MSQNPLATYYAQFANTSLPTTSLTQDEVDFIAVITGYPNNFQLFTEAINSTKSFERLVIRQSLVRILELEDLKIQSTKLQKVTKVEDIVLNPMYSDNLLNDLVVEIKKIASILRIPVLDNLYISSDNVEGVLNLATNSIERYRDRTGYGFGAWIL